MKDTVLTVVGSKPIEEHVLLRIKRAARTSYDPKQIGPTAWIFPVQGKPNLGMSLDINGIKNGFWLDWYWERREGDRRPKLFISDMDSTIIQQECIDELADFVGKKDEVEDITERAMAGELDFAEALDARVGLLKGLDFSVCEQVIEENIELSSGAESLVRTFKRDGIPSVLVSGGFDPFVSTIARKVGFDHWHGNSLEVGEDGKLTGRVHRPILTADTKLELAEKYASQYGVGLEDTVAMGDGANDIPMIRYTGFGVAYRMAKKGMNDIVFAKALIDYADLTALLYFLGYRDDEIVR